VKTQIWSFWEEKKWFKSLSLKIKMRHKQNVSVDFLLCWACREFSHRLLSGVFCRAGEAKPFQRYVPSQTAEAVRTSHHTPATPLKQGVNENNWLRMAKVGRTFRLILSLLLTPPLSSRNGAMTALPNFVEFGDQKMRHVAESFICSS
jgi:hypothetical protein